MATSRPVRVSVGVSVLMAPVVVIVVLTMLFAFAKGSYNLIESTCMDDSVSRPGYGAYTMEGAWWPPSVVCTVEGNGLPPIVVRHPLMAWSLTGALAISTLAVAVAVVLMWRGLVRPPASSARETRAVV